MDKQTDQKRLRKGPRKPSEALSWVGEGVGSLKRVQGLESWPFPTFKGQPLEPVVYTKAPRIDDSWEEALL